jgi:hypothetical protein
LKAGDLFTRVTIVVATVWILLCILAILILNPQSAKKAEQAAGGSEYVKVESSGEAATDTGGSITAPPGQAEAEGAAGEAKANDAGQDTAKEAKKP